MPEISNVYVTDYDSIKIQNLFYAVSGDFVSMSKTTVVSCRLPQRGAFLKAQNLVLDQSCCPRR